MIWFMKILARWDFERNHEPRFNNESYLNEYGNQYAKQEAITYLTRNLP